MGTTTLRLHAAALAVLLSAAPGLAQAQGALAQPGSTNAPGRGQVVHIEIENLTAGQTLSPSAFVSHNTTAPALFKEGEKASFGLQRVGEEGSAGALLSGRPAA